MWYLNGGRWRYFRSQRENGKTHVLGWQGRRAAGGLADTTRMPMGRQGLWADAGVGSGGRGCGGVPLPGFLSETGSAVSRWEHDAGRGGDLEEAAEQPSRKAAW